MREKVSGTPILKSLKRHLRNENSSFHTPGHKGQAGILSELESFRFDLTELSDTPDLFDVDSFNETALSEIMASRTFGAKHTIFSAGGCTLAIQTMMMAATGGSGLVLCARNSHRSAVNALGLLGVDVKWIWPKSSYGFFEQVTPLDVENAFNEESERIKAVFITSPDYYGRLADIKTISTMCKERGVLLIVDNAHGSHLGAFDLHPLSLGADMSADSCHKTLPVLTGGAMLHSARDDVFGQKIDRENLKSMSSIFASSSPNFMVLASLDLARDWFDRVGGQAYREVAKKIQNLRMIAEKLGVSVVYKQGWSDPARFAINFAELGIDEKMILRFFKDNKCEPEMVDSGHAVFIITPFNTPEDLKRLEKAVVLFATALRRGQFWLKKTKTTEDETADEERPIAEYQPHEIMKKKCKMIKMEEAFGEICARAVSSCPPGAPIIVPGEVFDANVIRKLKAQGFINIFVTI